MNVFAIVSFPFLVLGLSLVVMGGIEKRESGDSLGWIKGGVIVMASGIALVVISLLS